MSLTRILIIFRKELRDTLRDRRTIVMMVALPMVLMPALIAGAAALAIRQTQQAQERPLKVAYIDNGNASGLSGLFETRTDIQLITGVPADSLPSFIRGDSLDAAFIVGPSFDQQVQELRPGELTLMFDTGDNDVVQRRLRAIVDIYRDSLLAQRLEQSNLPSTFTETVDLQQVDLATTQEVMGRIIGGILPYMFLLFCYLGAMYPAIDLAAGEKERATLETLLTSPASRMEILTGKFIVVVLAGIASALVALLGVIIGLNQAPDMPPELLSVVESILTPTAIILEIALLIPLTMFFAALLLALSVFAKSFKEAQSIVSPISFLVIIPAAVGMMPGFVLSPVTAVIPVLNVSLATKDIIAGTIDPGLLAIVFVSLIVLAIFGLLLCARHFRNENVLFRT